MSAQSPLERLLGVPDLVENVFLRLDPASRRAFFQAFRDVAQSGHVLAHATLRIELSPGSLLDQWQRVLCLTRSQPPRSLILAGPSKEQLQDFLRCVPESKHEEKQRVLQGTEVQFQVHIKLETGGILRLQDLLRSWHDEQQQQQGADDTRVQLVLDLCGRELVTATDLTLPSRFTLRNGTLQLHGFSCVRVASDRVRFESTVIKGTVAQAVLEVVSGGRLEMEGCRVEEGLSEAVRVGGAEASLCAQRCSMQSSEGNGLWVDNGGTAALEHITISSCGSNGVQVRGKGSVVTAVHCRMDGNGQFGVFVGGGAYVCLRHCSSNDSRDHGCYVLGQGSRLVASDSSASSNKRCGVSVVRRANVSVSACTAKDNGAVGWDVCGQLSRLVVKACETFNNRVGNMRELANGCITCLDA